MGLVQVLGVDAGGSGSRWALAGEHGQVLRTGTGPALQLANLELEGAALAIGDLLSAPLAEVRAQPGACLVAIVAGFAGAGDAQHRRALENLLRERCIVIEGTKVRIVTDVEIGAAQALAPGPGIAAFAGTGSFVIAHTRDGTLLRVGGRGPLLGDAGSGYDIVRQAARLALLGLDGIGAPPSDLARALVTWFGAPALARLGVALHRATSRTVAAAAPLVFEHAQAGDQVARRALEIAFGGLADLVVALLDRTRSDRTTQQVTKLPVGGGVLRESATARAAFHEALARRGLEFELEPVAIAPAHAAVRLALDWCADRAPLCRWVEHGAA